MPCPFFTSVLDLRKSWWSGLMTCRWLWWDTLIQKKLRDFIIPTLCGSCFCSALWWVEWELAHQVDLYQINVGKLKLAQNRTCVQRCIKETYWNRWEDFMEMLNLLFVHSQPWAYHLIPINLSYCVMCSNQLSQSILCCPSSNYFT